MKPLFFIVVLLSVFCNSGFAESLEPTQADDPFGVIGLMLLGIVCLFLARRRIA